MDGQVVCECCWDMIKDDETIVIDDVLMCMKCYEYIEGK